MASPKPREVASMHSSCMSHTLQVVPLTALHFYAGGCVITFAGVLYISDIINNVRPQISYLEQATGHKEGITHGHYYIADGNSTTISTTVNPY